MDWQLNANQAVFTRYFFTDYQHPPYFTDNLLTLSTDASAGLKGRVQSFVIGHTFTLSSSTVNVFRIGYSRSSMIRYMPDNTPTSASLGAKVVQQGPPYLNWNINTYFTVACTNCNPGPWVSNSIQLSDELSTIRGAPSDLRGRQHGLFAAELSGQLPDERNFHLQRARRTPPATHWRI